MCVISLFNFFFGARLGSRGIFRTTLKLNKVKHETDLNLFTQFIELWMSLAPSFALNVFCYAMPS